MIRIDQITKDYGGSHPAIADLQFRIEPGRVTVMVGTTGSGKSTLIRLLAGLEVPTSGGIRWDNESHAPFGIVFQEPRLLRLNVVENVKFGLGPKQRNENARLVDEILEKVGLRAFSRTRSVAVSPFRPLSPSRRFQIKTSRITCSGGDLGGMNIPYGYRYRRIWKGWSLLRR